MILFGDVALEERERTAPLAPTAVRLLASSRLVLDADPLAGALLRDALPTACGRWTGRALGTIVARENASPAPRLPDGEPTLRVSGVSVWMDAPRSGDAMLRNSAGTVHGRVERSARRAMLAFHPAITGAERDEARVAFGLAVTMLMGHVGHAVVHAAAVVPPGGRAWLLAGDSRAGKSSATAALVAAGWNYLSDDSVVLAPEHEGDPARGIRVEGWRSGFRLDRGWRDGISTGERMDADPRPPGGGEWMPSALVGGILFPRVVANAPTALGAISQAAAFVELVRQSPWLLADRGSAPAVASLLSHAATAPAARISLGSDSYARPDRLAEILRPVCERG